MKEFQKINTYITQLDLITFKYIIPLIEMIILNISDRQIDQELGKPLFRMKQVNNPELVLLLKCYFFIANQARDSIMRILSEFTANTATQLSIKDFNKFILQIAYPSDLKHNEKIKELKSKLQGGLGILIKTRLLRNFLKYNDEMILYATNKNEVILKYKGLIPQDDRTKQVIDLLSYQTQKPDKEIFFQIMIPQALKDTTNGFQRFYDILLEYYNWIQK